MKQRYRWISNCWNQTKPCNHNCSRFNTSCSNWPNYSKVLNRSVLFLHRYGTAKRVGIGFWRNSSQHQADRCSEDQLYESKKAACCTRAAKRVAFRSKKGGYHYRTQRRCESLPKSGRRSFWNAGLSAWRTDSKSHCYSQISVCRTKVPVWFRQIVLPELFKDRSLTPDC